MYTRKDAKGSGGGRGRKPSGVGKSDLRDEFLNVELSVEQTAEFKAFRKEVDAINSVLTEMLEDGYKLTCRYDDYNECYACFAFAPDEHDNAGYILTGRGGSGLSAVAELLYKHSEVLGRNWPAAAARSRIRYTDDD